MSTSGQQHSLDALFSLALKRPYADTNSLAYNASYASLSRLRLNKSTTPIDSAKYRESAYSFCNINGYTCSIVMFNSVNMFLMSVSTHLYQVPHSSCNNQMSLPDSSWETAKSTPPTKLVEPYFSCVFTVRDFIYVVVMMMMMVMMMMIMIGF